MNFHQNYIISLSSDKQTLLLIHLRRCYGFVLVFKCVCMNTRPITEVGDVISNPLVVCFFSKWGGCICTNKETLMSK